MFGTGREGTARVSRLWGWAATTLLLLALGCASPVQELWPPAKGAPAHTIIVSIDTWHAMIAFPQNRTEGPGLRTEPQASAGPPDASPLTPHASYEEWGYAEQAWYLEGQMGFTGAIRALFWPSPGVVEVGHYNQMWSDRTPQPPAERFTFRLSEEGYLRLRQHLQETKASAEPVLTTDGSRFFPANRSYHVFHQCHHYSAHALREAGLPISTFWALTRRMFAAELRRAERIAAEAENSLPNQSGGL